MIKTKCTTFVAWDVFKGKGEDKQVYDSMYSEI